MIFSFMYGAATNLGSTVTRVQYAGNMFFVLDAHSIINSQFLSFEDFPKRNKENMAAMMRIYLTIVGTRVIYKMDTQLFSICHNIVAKAALHIKKAGYPSYKSLVCQQL